MGQIKTRCSAAAGLFLILLTVIAGFSSCKSNQKDIIPSAEYAPYVNAYTGGVISQNSTIRIELTQDLEEYNRLPKGGTVTIEYYEHTRRIVKVY